MNSLKTTRNYFFLLLFSIGLCSCSTDHDGDIIIEPVGASDYFINNQTAKDLILVFEASEQLGFEVDTTSVIFTNTSVNIFNDADFGVELVPTDSFNKIEIYDAADFNNTPLLIIDPIENDEWEIIGQDLGGSGFGLTEYELTLIDSDLN